MELEAATKLKLEQDGKCCDDNGTSTYGLNDFNNAGVNTMINVHDHINTLISKK